jgi:2-polyprenyl-3-methyl-5-hydroxy-6-metoxy-1,4-benzoquinol methylase
VSKKIHHNIICCRICGSKKIESVLDLGSQPTANQLTKKFNEKEQKIPLRLVFCKNCKTNQLSSTVESAYLFSKYIWVTKTSKVANDYSKIFYKRVIKKLSKKINYVCEIASNDGTFLKEFQKNKIEVLGVDPAKNIAKEANKNGITTISGFFNKQLAQKILKERKPADLIIARNVIPHVEDIHGVIQGIEKLLSTSGSAVIEFHYLNEILKGLQYDSIYHEHIYYFSVLTISNLFKRYNLFAYHLEKSPISGGSLVIYFSKIKKKYSSELSRIVEIEKKNKVNSLKKIKDFSRKCIEHSKSLEQIIKKTNGKVFGYGASARSSTLLNFCKIDHTKISFVFDKNPMKFGLYTPGSKIKIINFDKSKIKSKPIVVILAWNFSKEIIEDFSKKKIKAKFIIPLPKKNRFYEN